jgi:hypothetical protein
MKFNSLKESISGLCAILSARSGNGLGTPWTQGSWSDRRELSEQESKP